MYDDVADDVTGTGAVTSATGVCDDVVNGVTDTRATTSVLQVRDGVVNARYAVNDTAH